MVWQAGTLKEMKTFQITEKYTQHTRSIFHPLMTIQVKGLFMDLQDKIVLIQMSVAFKVPKRY